MHFGLRKLFISLLLLLWLPGLLQAQHEEIKKDFKEGRLSIDEKILYQLYAGTKPQSLPRSYQRGDDRSIKCGTPALMDFHKHRSRLSAGTVARVEALTSTPIQHATQRYRSRSGRFEINYSTAGEHAVPTQDTNNNGTPDYIEWVAQAADSSYRHEVQNLGYTDPMPDPGQPYQIYFENMGFYGYTDIVSGSTYIVMHNNYQGFPDNDDPQGNQRGAIRATAAHELKHAIQYAATGWSGESDQWAEMDATLMEEIVYDPVNDYYNYLSDSESIFNNPETSFYPGSYYHVSWALFFEEKYGPQFWPSVWTIIKNDPTITMIEALSRQLGGADVFQHDYVESQLWHYAAGPNNTADGFGFEERRHYPKPNIRPGSDFYTGDLATPRAVPDYTLERLSATYYRVTPPREATGNMAVEVSVAEPNTGVGVLAYFADGTTDYRIMTSGDNQTAALSTPWAWKDITSAGIVLTNSGTDSAAEAAVVQVGNTDFSQLTLHQNYPNPFRNTTTIRFTLAEPSRVKLELYDMIGRHLRTLYDQKLEAGLHVKTIEAGSLASGVYVYQLVTDRQAVAKKMTRIK
ncbi:MXAN_6640 family putative metalloprotease [Fodinibius sediminis]|nr:MXAN_6640 family putative metalloprotease [Fodinibius sediminis]